MTKLVLIFIKVAFTDGHPDQNCVMQKLLGTYSVAAAEFSGIGFTKLHKFACPMNLRIPQKTILYEHCKQFVFLEMDAAWRKNQVQQIEEINKYVCVLELAVDGQCDSPGHSATYNTVSATDAKTNKIINFRVVHMKF